MGVGVVSPPGDSELGFSDTPGSGLVAGASEGSSDGPGDTEGSWVILGETVGAMDALGDGEGDAAGPAI